MTSHRKIADCFIAEKKRTGCNMFTEKNEKGEMVVYSYGYHFPIAIKKDWGFIFNSDGYSSSTGKHKGIVGGVLSGKVINLPSCNEDHAKLQFKRNVLGIEELKGKQERARVYDYTQSINELNQQQEYLKELILNEILGDL